MSALPRVPPPVLDYPDLYSAWRQEKLYPMVRSISNPAEADSSIGLVRPGEPSANLKGRWRIIPTATARAKRTTEYRPSPKKGWFMILCLYGRLEPFFDKTWRPGEIELQP
jgi:hypothetical protein